MKKIYIAGPYSMGDQAMNVRNMIVAQDYIESALGHMAYNPLLSHFQHMVIPHEDTNYWYEKDLLWLRECDALLRLPGKSVGADKEELLARELGMTLYYSVMDIPKA